MPGKIGGGSYQDKADDPVIIIESDFTGDNKILLVNYEAIDGSRKMEYEIQVEGLPSNLGINNGLNLYLLCPITGKRAKILNYDLVNHLYVAKKSYSSKLYYQQEIIPRSERIFLKEDYNNRKMLQLFFKNKKQTYRGELVKTARNIIERNKQRDLIDALIVDRIEKDHGKI